MRVPVSFVCPLGWDVWQQTPAQSRDRGRGGDHAGRKSATGRPSHLPFGIMIPPTMVPNTTERVSALKRRGGM